MPAERSVASLPTGTLTMLFTDIEGSTRLLRQLGSASYAVLLAEHHRLLRGAISANLGIPVKTEGDSFFAVFSGALQAVQAAVDAQRGIAAMSWPSDVRVALRMGLHTGEVALSEGEYVGMDVHRAARIAAAGHGGQTLLSAVTQELVVAALPQGVSLRDMGEHQLRDIEHPEHIYQLVIDGLPGDFPPLRTESSRLELLPAETSAFIGRREVLGEARLLLSAARLLTLTGPGGTGKTRLALRLAREAAPGYRDGVAFVELAAISDPSLVLSTIRERLGLAEQPGQTPLQTVAEFFASRQMLLALDNFEQVVGAASEIGQLLESSPGLTIIVTSRVALHLNGEQEYAVPPLALPQPSDATDPVKVSESEAVALFIQRARAVRPDFELTAADAPIVAAICARLDGLPLAIELAASRIKLLPLAVLAERLEKSLDVLQMSGADRTDRQRTLRGAIGWSYDLLEGEERALFRRCSIFVGGWRLEEAERVSDAAGALAVDLFDGTEALLDHSLIRRIDTPDRLRFTMLETIREFGREQLAHENELEIEAAEHAHCFAELAEAAESGLTGGPEWLDRLEIEHANLRAAIGWLAEHDIDLALLTAGRLWRFWQLRGHLREGSRVISELLERPRAARPADPRAKALIGLAGLVYWQGDYPLARRCYEEALDIARRVGNRAVEVETLYSLAYVLAIEGDWDGAINDYRQAQAMYEADGNALMAAWTRLGVGMVTTLRGNHEESLGLLDRALADFRSMGDSFGQKNALAVKTRALIQLRQLEDARVLNREFVNVSESSHDPTSLSAALLDAASIDALEGRLERAARLVGTAHRVMEESGGQAPPALMNRVEPLPILKKALDTEELDRLLAEGRRLSVEAAASLALGSPGEQ